MENSVFTFLKSFGEHEQICHLYENDSECYEVAANYFIHGIKSGSPCVYVSDRHAPRELLMRLEGHGVLPQGNAKGRTFEEILIRSRTKEPERAEDIIELIEEGLEKILKKGKNPVRVLMALDRDPFFFLTSSERLWIKARLNKMCLGMPVTMMVQYNIERISSKELLSIFRTHPMIAEKNVVFRSPIYTEPGLILKEGRDELDRIKSLSGKEKKILGLITDGLSNSAIAQELTISIKTVETHRANIMKKLDIHNLVDLVKFSMRNGMA
ncbi:MAG TPA: LuxR C-terminal-related transcriptional regulator [Thermodesulfobacteriota bacterium]|nr:LuxR C-terminal-related transcriptional regulator [Thermodesulfobacteriota bacterium]